MIVYDHLGCIKLHLPIVRASRGLYVVAVSIDLAAGMMLFLEGYGSWFQVIAFLYVPWVLR